ncbi:monosaccharide ABC transporter substrate-binding protein, CUT2 family [Actinacidiphila yanglinensis]|uniref:Monosaccharide ABC transporter substrate-binding protein, CUT2 family n=1 Tax=Actinacidiphila yanglinensis TaxID=310779 RepID=A0A1H6B731_9ACTN|nr:ABC transporter substrate-binding protein [Actinacidiphila yanglinensis]SEG55936.1 monosaccharide ABC transporter substrate-binding protein, CUT2 family [Actinacidiphila yanglinensis]
MRHISRPTTLVGTCAVLALVAATTAACGGGSSGSGSKSLEMITGVKSDPFYITMACAAQQEAKKRGVKLTVNGSAQWDVAVQRPIIDSVAAKHPSGLLISPVDTAALTPSLNQMQNAGTKIVLVDTTVSDASIGVSRISSDNVAGGRAAAKALAKLMGDKGSAIVISVKPGVSTTDERTKGFDEEMKANHPNITLLPVLYDNDLPATAASQIQSTLAAHPDLGGVFAGNTNTAQGISTGLQAAGKQGKVKVAAFDAEPDEVTSLKTGTLDVLVAQDPARIGTEGVDQALAAIDKKKVTASIGTDMVAITKANLDSASVGKYLYKDAC